jgi:hypothetical protein
VTVGAKMPPDPPEPMVSPMAGALRRSSKPTVSSDSFPAIASSTHP